MSAQLDLNGGLGSLLIGACVNLLLFSQETTLLAQLLRRNWLGLRHDPLVLRLGLAAMYLADLTGTAMAVYCVYGYCITGWGDQERLLREDLSMPVVFIATGCSALVCQSFLIHRIFRLTKSRLLPAVLSAIALSGFAGSIAAAVTLLTHNTYAQRSANIVPVTVWLLCSAVADMSIAAVLSVFLWRARRTASQFDGSRLRGPLTKALHQTLECGGVVTAAALSALGVYLHDHVTNISVAIGFILGRAYALTILYCLFNRGSRAPNSDSSAGLPSASGPAGKAKGARPSSSFWNRGRKAVGGVTVHEETVVAHDIADEEERYRAESVYELGRLERGSDRVEGAPLDAKLYIPRGLTPEPGAGASGEQGGGGWEGEGEKGRSPASVRTYGYI